MATTSTPITTKRPRSPNYPAVGLREAVDRLKKLYEKDGKAGAPAEIAAVHIGFGKPHGQAMSVLAALKRFGLVSENGGRFAPSQRGLEIINLSPDDPRRQKALCDAVLEPSIYRELIDKHRESGWPANEVVASELETYKGFIKKAAISLVEDLKDSLEFSGLSNETALVSKDEEEIHLQQPSVGDFVQWESQGVLQFKEPRRIREISDDGNWAFVDGSNTGVPMTELTVAPTPASAKVPESPKLTRVDVPPAPKNSVEIRNEVSIRQDVFSLAEGQVMIQWPSVLSKESFEDIADWLKILERKIGRSVSEEPNE
jgi:hypothetical protein